MRVRSHLLRAVLAAGLVMTAMAAPAGAAKQELSPRVEVDGAKLPPADDTIQTADDPAIGQTAPTLVGEGFNGKPLTVEQGDLPRLVIFLAHWCPHCQREVPVLVKLAKQGVLDGIEVQTVATSSGEQYPNYPPSKWLKREKWPFKPVLADDAKGRALDAFGGTGFPYFVFVGSDGNVVVRTSGELSDTAVTELVRRVVAGDPIFTD